MNLEVGLFGLLLCVPAALYDIARGRSGIRVVYFLIWACVYAVLASNLLEFEKVTWTASLYLALAHLAVFSGTAFGQWLFGSDEQAAQRLIRLPPGSVFVALTLIVFLIGLACCQQLHGTINILQVTASDELDRDALLLGMEDEVSQGGWLSAAVGIGTGLLRVAVTFAAVWRLQRKRVYYSRLYSLGVLLTFGMVVYYSLLLQAKAVGITNVMQFIGVSLLLSPKDVSVGARALLNAPWLRMAAYGVVLAFIVLVGWVINYQLAANRDRIVVTPLEATGIYLAGPTVAFSMHLQGESKSQASADVPPMGYTFPAVARQFAKLRGDHFDVVQFKKYIHIPYYFNAFTWLYDFYEDAGAVGVFVMPFFLALLAMFLAYLNHNSGSVFTCSAYGFVFVGIALSFFNWSLVVTGHFVCLGLVWVLCKISLFTPTGIGPVSRATS